jgi:hypothetical protein
MHLRIVSWNLCGLGKLSQWPDSAKWLLDHDIIMVQESLQVTKTFPMFDVSRYDVHAIATSGRARGGLIVALQNRVFNAARVTVLCEEEYALFLRIEIPASDFTLVVGNVYAPVHSPGFTPEILRTIGSQLDIISAQHPSASIVIAGNPRFHRDLPNPPILRLLLVENFSVIFHFSYLFREPHPTGDFIKR